MSDQPMGALPHLLQAVTVTVVLYGLALLLRRQGVLTENHSLVLARLVTDLFLPATIFVSLAGQTIQPRQLEPAFVMLAVQLGAIALSWSVSALLRFPRAQQGAIVFCSAFSSSTFLGYALIREMYPDNPQALTEAVLISEIGVGYLLFILGPILAAYFGSEGLDTRSRLTTSLAFFKSPVFFALVIGLLWSLLRLPGQENVLVAPLFQVCQILSGALTPVAILSVALLFRMPSVRGILAPLSIVVAIDLLLQPLAAGLLASLFGFPKLWRDVLVMLAAMPPAVLGVVFLRRHGADASMASALLLAATIISSVTVLLVFSLVG
jgi:malate permease and related proteins